MNILRLLFLLCAAVLPANAQKPAPFLWKIEGTKSSYVFGTIHLANPELTKLSDSTAAAVDGADALYCELPLDMGSQMAMTTSLLGAEKPLNEVLPRDLYERAENELKRINPALNLAPFATMKVWALSVTISMLEDQLKNMGKQPLDAVLYNRAAAGGKEVGGIETIAEQLGVLDKFSIEEQIEMLRATLDDMERSRKEGRSGMAELRAAYLSGDLSRVEKTVTEWMTEIKPGLREKVVEALFDDRNRIMAERIVEKLKAAPEKSFFFAIGAGHLYGKDGVLARIEKAGFKVSRTPE